ncbi:UDP-N-acetylmuramate dehydrogenase [Flavobacteriaceae bacterium Ap0902]|nr:UDP-N-acetylmuramate dehydrogenase [Flavobacteriaceae bacterium Ap0902]
MYSIQSNQKLKPFTTMAIDVVASNYVAINTVEDLQSFLKSSYAKPLYILGGGSNIVFLQDYPGTVLHIHNLGKGVMTQGENEVLVKANAGENWHEFVLWALSHDFGGLENLSLIPGRVGASPMQNIGAYGREIKDVFYELEAVEIATGKIRIFNREECQFGYRDSIFKNELKGQYIITSVIFRLTTKHHQLKTDYGAIQNKLASMNVNNPTIQDVSKAVIAIRESKLPDPKKIPNCGSFFKNPTILNEEYLLLKQHFPEMPGYVVSDTHTKVPAGWLIDFAGWKGFRNETVGVHDRQALVLINHHEGSGKDILNLSNEIVQDIDAKFGIKLEREVNMI